MPMFNDIGFYLSGGYNPYTPSYSSPSRSGLLPFSPPTFSKPTLVPNSGMRYRPEPKPFSPPYSGARTTQFSGSPYVSNYTTYTDWKENLLLNKLRDDKSYRWKDKNRNNIYYPSRPVFVDTSKIDVTRPRPKRECVSAESEKENKFENDGKEIDGNNQVKGTITRGRTVVRIHTKALKENPYFTKRTEEAEGIKAKSKKSSVRKSKKRASIKKESESDTDDEDGEGNVSRDNTVKKRTVKKKGKDSQKADSAKNVEKEGGTLLGGIGTIVRKCKIRKRSKERRMSTDSAASQDGISESRKSSLCPVMDEKRRLSMELFEEQSAVLDSLIQKELERKDADDYFSDPKRGTVKITSKQRLSKSERDASRKKLNREMHTESSTTDDDLESVEERKRTTKRKSKTPRSDGDSGDSSSGSRRNSLFQDLFLEATIAENTLGELEDQEEQAETKKAQNKKWKLQQKSLKTIKRPNRTEEEKRQKKPVISAIIEVEEKPKTPRFFIDNVEVISSAEVPNKFNFDFHSDSNKTEETSSNDEGIPKKQDTVIKKLDKKAKSIKKTVMDQFKKSLRNESKVPDKNKPVEKEQKNEPKKQVNNVQQKFQKLSEVELLKNKQNIQKTQLIMGKDKNEVKNEKVDINKKSLIPDSRKEIKKEEDSKERPKPVPKPLDSVDKDHSKLDAKIGVAEQAQTHVIAMSEQKETALKKPEEVKATVVDNSKPAIVDKSKPAAVYDSKPTAIDNSKTATVSNSKPAVLDNSKTAIVDNSKPTAVDNSKTATVNNSKPAVVDKSKPAAVYDSKPAVVDNSKPTAVDNSKTATVNNSKPAVVDKSKPAAVYDSKPAVVDNSKPTAVDNSKTATVHNSKPTAVDNSADQAKAAPEKLKLDKVNAPAAHGKTETTPNWKQQLASKLKVTEQKLPKELPGLQNKAKVNQKDLPKNLKKPKKKHEKFPLLISTFESPKLIKPDVLTLPPPSKGELTEISAGPQKGKPAEDESSMSETASDGTDSATETEEESESHSDDDGEDKLRPSYSNDSGFGSAYQKNRTGISVIFSVTLCCCILLTI